MIVSAALLLMTTAGAQSLGPVESALKTGRPLQAATMVQTILEQTPDDAEAMVLGAVARSRAGMHGDALGAFAICHSGDAYERYGLTAHADSLRATGLGLEAAALRSEGLMTVVGETAEALLYVDISDDLALIDPSGALDAALSALTLRPNSPQVHAALSERYREQGQYLLARSHAAAAEALGVTLRGHIAQALLSLEEGQVATAHATLELARDMKVRTDRLIAARVETHRRAGSHSEALALLALPTLKYSEEPEVLATSLRVARDVEDRTLWSELTLRAAPVAGHPLVQRELSKGLD